MQINFAITVHIINDEIERGQAVAAPAMRITNDACNYHQQPDIPKANKCLSIYHLTVVGLIYGSSVYAGIYYGQTHQKTYINYLIVWNGSLLFVY